MESVAHIAEMSILCPDAVEEGILDGHLLYLCLQF